MDGFTCQMLQRSISIEHRTGLHQLKDAGCAELKLSGKPKSWSLLHPHAIGRDPSGMCYTTISTVLQTTTRYKENTEGLLAFLLRLVCVMEVPFADSADAVVFGRSP